MNMLCINCLAPAAVDVPKCKPGEIHYKPCACGAKGVIREHDQYEPRHKKKSHRRALREEHPPRRPPVKFLFVAPSGNQAVLTILTVGDRSVCDFSWRDTPPAAEDIGAAERAAGLIIASQSPQGEVCVVASEYIEDDQARHKSQREFLGGGQG